MQEHLASLCRPRYSLGVKRTCVFAAHMSAYDPKRTSRAPFVRRIPPSCKLTVVGRRATG
jgi:hypothetical protein